MAIFRKYQTGDETVWVVADLPAGVEVGDKVSVTKAAGTITSVVITGFVEGDEGERFGTIKQKARKAGAATGAKPAFCSNCGHPIA